MFSVNVVLLERKMSKEKLLWGYSLVFKDLYTLVVYKNSIILLAYI